MFGWGNLNGGPAAMADGVEKMETALRAAQAYGADTVLLVPCRIDGMAIPEPWEFDIRFDEKTGPLDSRSSPATMRNTKNTSRPTTRPPMPRARASSG